MRYLRILLLGSVRAVPAFALLLIFAGVPEHVAGSARDWTESVDLDTDAPGQVAASPGSDSNVQFATDGADNWIAVWESTNSLGGTIGSDLDILVARSADKGITWTEPLAVNANAAADSVEDGDPHVATDGFGNWVAVWEGGDSVRISRSTSNGLSWTDQQTIEFSDGVFDSREPQAAADREGNFIVVVEAFQRMWFPGDTEYGGDADIWATRSTDGGTTWTLARPVNTNAAVDWEIAGAVKRHFGDFDPDVATDGAGNLWVVWSSDNPFGGAIGYDWDILLAQSSDGGVTWTGPMAFGLAFGDGADDNDWDPRIATDQQGTWVAAWDFWAPTRIDVRQATWSSEGVAFREWSSGGPDLFPEVASDGGSNWVMVWFGGPGAPTEADYDIWVTRSGDGGGSWAVHVPLNSDASVDIADDQFPDVATDGKGTWLAAWDRWGDILLARSTDGGQTWTDPQPFNTTAFDGDGDGVPDSSDNCPAWPNPGQSLPLWTVPADDPDCDGWSTADENLIGTDPLAACGGGAWPPDTFEDQLVDSQDMVALLPGLFKSVGQPGYSARLDIFQPGTIIDSQDLVVFLPFLFKVCT
jgi:hypothetical protein